MKPQSNKFTHKQMKHRFEKIVKHVVSKNSPSDEDQKDDAEGVEDEADADGQEGKKPKKLPNDLRAKDFV